MFITIVVDGFITDRYRTKPITLWSTTTLTEGTPTWHLLATEGAFAYAVIAGNSFISREGTERVLLEGLLGKAEPERVVRGGAGSSTLAEETLKSCRCYCCAAAMVPALLVMVW